VKELLKKKSVKISVLLIILLVVLGIVGINVQSAQKSKEYEAHIAAAEKYLSELDYEQAIVEYTMAFEIDPKEEVVDALEQAYLAYAQTYIDVGEYEIAASILEEGYETIRRESLQNLDLPTSEAETSTPDSTADTSADTLASQTETPTSEPPADTSADTLTLASLPVPEANVTVEKGGGSDMTGSGSSIWTQTYDSGSNRTGGHIGWDGELLETVAESTDAYGVTYRSYAFSDPANNVQSAMDALAGYMAENPDSGFTAFVKKSGSEIVIVTYPALFPNGIEGLEMYPDIDLLAWDCFLVDDKMYILCADNTFDWLEGTPRPDIYIPQYLTGAFTHLSSILK